MASKRLFLIDGHALCYRSFYAIRELTTSKGQPSNAVFGFVRMIKNILRDYNPEYLAVCFDSKGKTFRAEKFAEYKIQRPAMPDELRSQIPIIKEVMDAFRIAQFELEGYEADDIIGTLTSKNGNKDLEVVIVSDDKDMYQLADKHIKFFSTRNNAFLTMDDVKDKLGFDPVRITDFIGLAGDSADNIPGVSGVGKVTATNLIQEYGPLEDIYKNVDKLKGKVKDKLIDQKDNAFFSRDLAFLETKVPLKYKLKDLEIKEADEERLFEIFKELEFKTLASEYATDDDECEDVDVSSLKNKKDFDALKSAITKQKEFAFIIGKSDEDDLFAVQSCLINTGTNQVFEMPVDQLKELKSVFEDKNISKTVFDLKSCLKQVAQQNISLNGAVFDVMLANYLIAPSQANQRPEDMAWVYLKRSISGEHIEAKEVKAVFDLKSVLLKELKSKSLETLLDDIEVPLSLVLFEIESEGVALDLNLLNRLSKECEEKISSLTKKLHSQAGEEFNLNSPKQLSHILFEKLKLPVIKKTKTGFSTDEGVLTLLAENHEIPNLILEYRQLSKLKSTYIDALPKMVDPETKRIHAQFIQTGTETGRLSSKNPNLQNIPIRTELGRAIRKAIIPGSKDNVIVAADYSQIELRILAHLSKDETLINAFKNNQDIHQYTASLIFDVDEKDVDRDMRYAAKRVNFGIVYGMSSFGLSKDLKITPGEAQEFIDKYFSRYPKVKEYMDQTIIECEKNGYVTTMLKRRRYLPEIKSKNGNMKQFAERQAINTPVQGSAADLMKLAMINVQNELKKSKLKSKMIMTVHDELVFDTPKEEVKELAKMVKTIMESAVKLIVPIIVSVKFGKNWMEMEEV